jgi:parallel beta-helix repeat protein
LSSPELLANANGPYSGTVNIAISFTGSATGGTPPNSYRWEFGDGATSNLQNPSHSYSSAGTCTANLTVTDNDGTTAKNSTQVTVTPPVATIPVITDFKVVPNMSVNESNPAVLSANVTGNLLYISFMVVDSNNLVRPNRTIIFDYANATGVNGEYQTSWNGEVLEITNETGVRTYVYPIYVYGLYVLSSGSWCESNILVPADFNKNTTTTNRTVFLWFNKTTYKLSNITTGNMSDILNTSYIKLSEVEPGVSTVKMIHFEHINGIDQPPVWQISGKEEYKLYNIGDSRNPFLILSNAPSGNYKAVVHAVSKDWQHSILRADVNVKAPLAISEAPNITSFAPISQVSDTVGATRTFNITVNQTVNVTWYINGTEVFSQTDITQSTYANTSAAPGTWNVTAVAQNANGTDAYKWDWIVMSLTGVTNVSSCTNITAPGTYELNQSIMNSNAVNCIIITSNDVVFDGAGYTIDGAFVWNPNYHGIYVYNSTTLTNITVKNLKVTDWYHGIFYNNVINGNITNNIGTSNVDNIELSSSNKITIINNKGNLNYNGIVLSSSNSIIVTYNNMQFNSAGIYLSYANNTTVYNNYFNNTINAFDNGNNTWNITKTAGVNIIGGPYLGGNFWASPNGTGFSQTCADADKDGICDSTYMLSSQNTDYLPLAYYTSDAAPPDVTNAAANQSDIPDDTDHIPLWGETAQLNVTVIDESDIASVTVNLSEIGGAAAKPMLNIGDNIYSATTNASAGTLPRLYNLTVNATDIYGNSNTSVRIQLKVMKNGDTTGNGVVNIGDALRLANNVSYPGNSAYALSSIYVAEVTGNGVINIGDALRLANSVSYPGNPAYILK